nr:C2H2-type zinc finger protein [Candidatus Njordarchaeota archaeon]
MQEQEQVSGKVKVIRNKLFGGPSLYKCLDCGCEYETLEALKKHQDAIRRRDDRLRRKLERLQRGEIDSKDRDPHTCPVCGELFVGRHGFNVHMGRKHGIYTPKRR